jgi:hypothetical protein
MIPEAVLKAIRFPLVEGKTSLAAVLISFPS